MERREEPHTGRRIALLIQYNGTNFNGWQMQNKGRTVQDEIEKAIKILTKEDVRVTASGRTDAGVHALGQVIHFNLNKNIPLQRICNGLNGILDKDISIKNAYNVIDDFHSRYSAVEREYKYLIYNHVQRTPFMEYRAMWVYEILDVKYLKDLSTYLIGEHDFASFCKKKSSEIKTIRKINKITITKNDELIVITIRGNAFLHNMIRIIIGTFVEMNRVGDPPEKIKNILEAKDRNASGKTAPAYGLYLNKIVYDPDLSAYESAF